MSSKPNTPEADELEVLATLIELYEDKYFPIESPDPIASRFNSAHWEREFSRRGNV